MCPSTRRRSAVAIAVVVLPLRLVSAASIIVPDDRKTIGEAVAAAAAGDTIRVRTGTYSESIVIAGTAKNGLTLEGLEGRPRIVPPRGHAGIRVERARRVTIRGVAVEGGTSGVDVRDAAEAWVTDVHVTGSTHGIRLGRCTPDCEVSGSTIRAVSPGSGIQVRGSAGVTVSGNVVVESRREGIRVSRSDALSLDNNLVEHGGADGIRVSRCDAVAALEANVARANRGSGLRLEGGYVGGSCPSCGVSDNIAEGNRRHGFRIRQWARLSAPGDLTALGNRASGNRASDFRVWP
jgi:parallel beta-helix repeat protein